MRAITVSGVILARVMILLAYVVACLALVGVASGLSFAGYLMFQVGLTKLALLLWACACLPLVLIGILGSLLPSWMRDKA